MSKTSSSIPASIPRPDAQSLVDLYLLGCASAPKRCGDAAATDGATTVVTPTSNGPPSVHRSSQKGGHPPSHWRAESPGRQHPTAYLKKSVHIIVAAVIFGDDTYQDVLLVQEAKASCRGRWYLPAGRMEPKETLTMAVKREVLEEAGLNFEPTALIAIESGAHNWFRFTFVGKVTGGKLKTPKDEDEESIQAKYFPLLDICGSDKAGVVPKSGFSMVSAGTSAESDTDGLVRNKTKVPLRSHDVIPLICSARQIVDINETKVCFRSVLPSEVPHGRINLSVVFLYNTKSAAFVLCRVDKRHKDAKESMRMASLEAALNDDRKPPDTRSMGATEDTAALGGVASGKNYGRSISSSTSTPPYTIPTLSIVSGNALTSCHQALDHLVTRIFSDDCRQLMRRDTPVVLSVEHDGTPCGDNNKTYDGVLISLLIKCTTLDDALPQPMKSNEFVWVPLSNEMQKYVSYISDPNVSRGPLFLYS